MIGCHASRNTTSGYYYPGIAFNHMLGYSDSYKTTAQGWIGLRLYDTPGSERSYLVFATKEATSNTGADRPVERMCIDPFGKVGIGTTAPSEKLEVSGTVKAYQFKTAYEYIRIGGSEGEAIGTGSRAISIGSNANASGSRSIAIGSGDISSAAKASGSYSIAIGGCYSGGTPAQATADGTTSIGGGASSTSWYSTALGYHAVTGAQYSLALGAESTANYSSSVAIGYSVDTSQSGEVNINNSIITKAVSVYCSSNSAFSTGITLPAFSSGFIIISSESTSADSYYHHSFRYDGSTLRTAEVASYYGPTVSMSGSTLCVTRYRNTSVRYTVMVLYTIDHY
jgi:hypothetical protein